MTHKVVITFPLQNNALDVFNELLAHDVEKIIVDTRHHLSYETHITDELINQLRELYQVKIDVTPHFSELEQQVIDILKNIEDNTIDLDYPVRITREGMDGEYFDDVRVVYYAAGCLTFGCDYSDIFRSDLSSDELTEIYQNIIEQWANNNICKCKHEQ